MQLKNYGVQQMNRGQNYFHFRDKIIPEYAHVACSTGFGSSRERSASNEIIYNV